MSVCAATLPYVWNGTPYNAPGSYVYHTLNAAGCDSAATLVLSIKNETTSSTPISVCAATLPYVWYVFPALLFPYMNRQGSLLYSEIFIFLMESLMYKMFFKIGWKWCVFISLTANLASYYIGPVLRAYGFWIYW